MSFNTVAFAIFVASVICLYYLAPKKYQWVFLLIASYFFYAFASVKFIPFIVTTTITSYFAAIMIDNNHKKEKLVLAEKKDEFTKEEKKNFKNIEKKKRRRILVALLFVNFGILAFLKYYNFFADNINALIKPLVHQTATMPHLKLLLPLGISFYTFQTMSYVIDVYWKKIEAERNLGKVALFVSFFPQMFLGPIGRFKDLSGQLFESRGLDVHNIKFGLQLAAWGYFKKMVIADRVGIIVDSVFAQHGDMAGSTVAISVFLYAIQDYTDFSGGVDIVRGIAQTMGINMAENFKRPYFSRTVAEFWRRWHISLGAWMKDYVFYPFALTSGMKKFSKFARNHCGDAIGKTLPIAIGNILVFFLIGIWHGASWNYIAWGIYYGLVVGLGGMLKPVFEWMNNALHIKTTSRLFILWQILRTFWLTCVGCIIFRAASLCDAWQIFEKSFYFFQIPHNYVGEFLKLKIDLNDVFAIPLIILILFVVDLMQERMHVRTFLENRSTAVRLLVYFIGFLLIVSLGMYGPGFDQNQFTYVQF
ncbi:MAG: MBOAT family protein [Eubacteriales bacterium]|nr:MBOAT family protein [Eubacteriales bacterium]